MCLCLFGNFRSQRSRLSRIGFIQSPKDEILISLKKQRIASKLDSPKPKKSKKFKEMMDKNKRIYLTIVQHSRQEVEAEIKEKNEEVGL